MVELESLYIKFAFTTRQQKEAPAASAQVMVEWLIKQTRHVITEAPPGHALLGAGGCRAFLFVCLFETSFSA